MSVRHAVLGLLAEAPMSGYDLHKRFEHSLAAILPARHNQIYMELKRLLDAGSIEQVEYGSRNRKLYAITDAGTVELRAWLLAEPEVADRALRFEPLLRANFLWLLDPEDAGPLLAREEAFFRERHAWLVKQMGSLPDADGDGSVAARRQVATAGLVLYAALADWLGDYQKALGSAPE